MSELKQKQTSAIANRQLQLRLELFPGYAPTELWLRSFRTGFTTLPRTAPLIFRIMDKLSKGRPVSSTYLDLWCRSYDECLAVLNRPRDMAFAAGFTGQRAEQTWQSRMEILKDLGFIDTKKGPSGPFSYALILNPYKVIKRLRARSDIELPEEFYTALLARSIEIGANDLTEPDQPAAAAPPQPVAA